MSLYDKYWELHSNYFAYYKQGLTDSDNVRSLKSKDTVPTAYESNLLFNPNLHRHFNARICFTCRNHTHIDMEMCLLF